MFYIGNRQYASDEMSLVTLYSHSVYYKIAEFTFDKEPASLYRIHLPLQFAIHAADQRVYYLPIHLLANIRCTHRDAPFSRRSLASPLQL